MEIVRDKPPNFQDILAVFPEASKPGVLFCYGESIYNPSGGFIPPHLIDHESVHSERQAEYKPKVWWELYLTQPFFRLQEELMAHQKEWETYCKYNLDRNWQIKYLHSMANRLSGPLYGKMISFKDALKEIRDGN